MALFGKGERSQIIAAIIVSLGAVTVGTVLGRRWTPGGTAADAAVAEDEDAAAAFVCASAAVGALLGGALAAAHGHRPTAALSEAMAAVGWALAARYAAGERHAAAAVGRALQGLAAGAISATVPAYVAEISQPHMRGALGVLFHAFFVAGLLYSYALALITDNLTVIIAMCAIWPVIHATGVFFVPESPYVYLQKGQLERANTPMARLRDDYTVLQELSVIQADIDQQTHQQNTFLKVLTNQANLKALTIGLSTLVIFSLADVRFIMTDVILMCEKCDRKRTLTAILLAVQLVVTLVTMKIIDKVGRKVLLIVSGILMGLCTIGFYSCFKFIDDLSNLSWLLVLLINIYMVAFSLGFGPVPWVIMGEIFPTKIKILGPGSITAFYWLMALIHSANRREIIVYPEEKAAGTGTTLIVRSAMWFLGSLFVWLIVPETKNKSLVQIKAMLTDNGDSHQHTYV